MRTNDEIVSLINRAREEKNMSISELARQTGMAKSAVSRYLNKTREFPLNRVNDFAKVLGMTPEFIIGLGSDNPEPTKYKPTSSYNYFDAGLSAGIPNEVDPFTSDDVTQIQLSDAVMGRYAGDKDIFISHVNGESMNRVLPDRSLIAVKQVEKSNLSNGDIVVFEEDGCYSVKRYYNNPSAKVVTFTPDSTKSTFEPMAFRYEDMSDIKIVGKVVVYTVVMD